MWENYTRTSNVIFYIYHRITMAISDAADKLEKGHLQSKDNTALFHTMLERRLYEYVVIPLKMLAFT